MMRSNQPPANTTARKSHAPHTPREHHFGRSGAAWALLELCLRRDSRAACAGRRLTRALLGRCL
eukprot:4475356-Lingulodinium_polyedra.AAC.1